MNGFEKEKVELSGLLSEFARIWFKSKYRPRPSQDTLLKWQRLLKSWIQDESMSLYIRKPSVGRGKKIKHKSGRILIPTDNSPSHWSFTLALNNRCPKKTT